MQELTLSEKQIVFKNMTSFINNLGSNNIKIRLNDVFTSSDLRRVSNCLLTPLLQEKLYISEDQKTNITFMKILLIGILLEEFSPAIFYSEITKDDFESFYIPILSQYFIDTDSNGIIPFKKEIFFKKLPVIYYGLKDNLSYKDKNNILTEAKRIFEVSEVSCPNIIKLIKYLFSSNTEDCLLSFFKINNETPLSYRSFSYIFSFILNYHKGLWNIKQEFIKEQCQRDGINIDDLFKLFLEDNKDTILLKLKKELEIFLEKINSGTINY